MLADRQLNSSGYVRGSVRFTCDFVCGGNLIMSGYFGENG